ncbi:MAG: 50S ribosome-binding GTPase [Oscillospiraceae bacterium]|nr:50S ribosome-binding GTPase [Oscillospiraceae bacterium]
MEYRPDEIVRQTMEAINQKIRNMNTLNIIIVGKSGVGKSTLINSVFREDLAETGIGRPVTQSIRRISKNGFPLTVYDTPGFELGKGQQDQVKAEVMKLIKDGLAGKDINKAIHCIWYCINVGSNRTFDNSELEWLRSFTEENRATRVPVFIVLTQGCPKKKAEEMRRLVEAENLDVSKVIPVLAQDMNFDDEYVAKAYGLDNLIAVMGEELPDDLQDTLQNVQKVSLKSKKKRAQTAVAAAVTAAFGEGFAPVPFADAAMLIPTQITMIATITAIFGLDVDRSVLMGFVSSALGTGGATVVGRSIATNLLKLVPGAGTLTGGVISGATAGLVTTALGEAYIKLMEQMYLGTLRAEDLQGESGRQRFLAFFQKTPKGELPDHLSGNDENS